ncbi:indole-3-glycerol phosphate synthase, chloroplastic-like [Lolium rigidum]|uniref:indole-3-glycerol phosphate synthase, chloroplastic-like n=1 Tax=Lolium rigidum TaxID=89674 RepID=UPI001F5C6E52|nr:indole-3-glycerol phosphate synthase, chloroplastic-like [Lolium rigidum]
MEAVLSAPKLSAAPIRAAAPGRSPLPSRVVALTPASSAARARPLRSGPKVRLPFSALFISPASSAPFSEEKLCTAQPTWPDPFDLGLHPSLLGSNTVQALARDEMLGAAEPAQWEDAAASQGVRIRRHRRPTASMRAIEEAMGAPRNILEKIIWDKEIEVAEGLARNPLKEVIESAVKAPPTRDFYGALAAAYKRNGVPALIAEVKKASPSRGVIRENFDPVEIAQAYEKHGAACLSILTDEKYFQGSFENLRKVRKAGVKCPLLCKEFVIDEWQIYYARSIGADAVLLIAAVLTDMDLKYLLRICKELGLTALIEVHDENEMERVLRIDDVQLIGINNRSLETFIVDTSNTKTLLEKHGNAIRQKGILVVGESGLFNPDDVAYVQNAGVSAVLVGESLVKQEDPGRAIAGLFGKELLH